MQTSTPVTENGESTRNNPAKPLFIVPIPGNWQLDSVDRIKANLEYLTPDKMRIKFPWAAAESLLFSSSPEDSEITLTDLFSLSDANEISEDWLHSLVLCPPLLRAIVYVAELITPIDGVLDPKSPCARVFDFLFGKYPAGTIMPAICTPVVDGAVALRHILRRTRPASSLTPPSPPPSYLGEAVLVRPVLDHAFNIISKSGPDSMD